MKIRTKLILGLSLLPILILLLLSVGWYQLTTLNKIGNRLQEDYELSLLAEQIHKGIKNQAISLRNIALFRNDESIQQELSILQTESESVTNNIALLEEKVSLMEQKEKIAELKHTNEKFQSHKDKLIEFVDSGKKEVAIQLMDSEGRAIHDEFLQQISAITDTYETNMDSSLRQYSEDFGQIIVIGAIISFLGLIIVISLVFKNVYSLATRLNKVSSVMNNVANGSADLGTKVEVTSKDELGDVGRSFNKMVVWLEEQMHKEQSLLWIKSNIAEITTSLSGTYDLKELAQMFLSKAVPLTESSHAVFYVKEEQNNEPIFKLLASYAFKERKHLSITFGVGEGLVGQAALEKKPIILTGVPSDYIRIKSGLGEAPPLNVYVLPVIFEGDVKAVLEIASFKPFSLDQQTLLEELMGGLGVLLDSVMGRLRLAKLLEEQQMLTEEIQTQSEELQSQQEELRITNEELEEQTQALRQSEEKLQLQQEELEQTNAELKEKADSLAEQNRRFELKNREVEKARAQLEEKAKQLSLSSKYKSEFLANMSHELRTPLNSLLILSKLLADNMEGNLSEKQVEYAKTIYSSGSDLLTLINNILDLAKIESGKVEVQPHKVEIQNIEEFVEQSFRPLANEHKLSFDIHMKDGIPDSLYSDEHRIRQVLRNLLANAFKFTHKGGVTLEIDFSTKLDKFAFSIVDTGIGVPKEKLELIFEAFQQADGTTSRKYGGTGLGLSICREIAVLLGGEIIVESKEGKGSAFTFYVGDYEEKNTEISSGFNETAVSLDKQYTDTESRPIVVEELESIQIPNKDESSKIKRLLIVDDDVKQRNSIMELIADKNVILKGVATGAEAMEELKMNQFDCMILDLGLTDTTGFDLLEEIKTKVENENLEVFIYTGRDLSSKEEIYLTKYAHTIIIKDEHAPQRLKDELELFLHVDCKKMEEIAAQPFTVQKQRLPNLVGKRVLLVDDDVRNVYALSSILELYGMDITFAENGVEGLELLDRHSDFDLVLMDIMMPEMDGYEAIRRIRENPLFDHLPVIALTAKAMKEDREKCMEVGASDYIVKPVDPDQLISLIKVWLYT